MCVCVCSVRGGGTGQTDSNGTDEAPDLATLQQPPGQESSGNGCHPLIDISLGS